MKQPTFYITTPIYYPSGKLHIGNSYTTVLCDTINRYKKLRGYDAYYLTGMDEHGQKIETVAKELGRTPQDHVDYMAEETKQLWKLLDVEYDGFIRTTEPRHEKVVEQIFEQLLKQKDIYLGHYEGHYCMYDESFFTETQLEEGNVCPDCGRPTQIVKEESYFLKLSKYQDWLLDFIEQNPDFITPEQRKNEVVAFIKQGLQDLSVSRTSFDWGVTVKSNPNHVVYVWIDALSNYITALGYGSEDTTLYDKYWNGDEVIHVVGKDILRFHAIYWPIMLHALGVPVNFRLYAHGWYLMKDGKMSKSQGKVVYPDDLIPHYGLDPMRYFLLKELPYSGDGIFTPEDFVARINYDLANDFGNLLNRTINMINKYFDSTIHKPSQSYFEFDQLLQDQMKESIEHYASDMDQLKVSNAIGHIWTSISRSNKYIDETMPWVLAKDPDKKPELESVMYNLVESLRQIGILLKPILLEASNGLFEQLNIPLDLQTWDSLGYGKLDTLIVTTKPTPLFPRLDKKKEEAFIADLLNKKKEEKKEDVKEENFITIEDFAKLEFVVGEVVSCEKHPDADKLLVSQVNTGDRTRQIVSGISKFYTPEDMVGKKVIIIKNLKPVKLRGVLSEGMLLAGSNKKQLEVLEVNNLKPGDKVS
jgi:methionyl-tRNA synthetase